MRVLLLSDFYPPVAGGVEQHVRTLAQALAGRGHDVAVATVDGRGSASDATDDGPVRVHRLRSLLGRLPGAHAEAGRPFAPPAPDPGLTLGLARLARSFRPDVVHAHTWLAHSWLPLRPLVRTPLVVTLHEYGLACARKSLVQGDRLCSGPSLAKCLGCAADHYGPARGIPIAAATLVGGPILRRAADRLIAVSWAVARGSGLRPDQVTIIPNMVPAERSALSDELAGRLPDRPFVLFVGALGVHKGIRVLFEAWEQLARSRPDLPPLVAIGHRWADTPRATPAGVTVLEDWPHGAVMGAWDRAMLGVIPSTWPEPFGIVALEAMAAGRPVVASRIGGLPDVVRDGETGLLVEPGDPQALAAAIARLLDDASLREALGAHGRARVASYRVDAIVPRIEAVYDDVLAGRPSLDRGSTPDGRPGPDGPPDGASPGSGHEPDRAGDAVARVA